MAQHDPTNPAQENHMSQVHIVTGGQYGSEAKGHVVAQLIDSIDTPPLAVRVGGPNAGHTIYTDPHTKLVFRTIPVGIVHPDSMAVIAAGSEIDIDVLIAEADMLDRHGIEWRDRLFIDLEATVITEAHKHTEAVGQYRARFGSTSKGIGAARAARLTRDAPRVADLLEDHPILAEFAMGHTSSFIAGTLTDHGQPIIVEGTQGYGLGNHAGRYPYCTAGDCRAIDFAAQAGIPAGVPMTNWLVFRTYPIRVAGNSGPMYNEISWDTLAERTGGYVKPEQTTVTKLIRRVGEWDHMLAYEALRGNGWPVADIRPVLMFTDYLDPSLAGSDDIEQVMDSPAWPTIREIEHTLNIHFYGFGTGPWSFAWR
jgi:adenylosuccinate synthase